jgi:hypothetical protein
MIFEDFVVEVPASAGFLVGDRVESIMCISLREGFVLGSGVVVRVDTDPGQDLLPVVFVVGEQTHVKSPLLPGSLRRIGRLKAKL